MNNVSSYYNWKRITKNTDIAFVAKDLGQMLNSKIKLKKHLKNSSEKHGVLLELKKRPLLKGQN